MNMKFERDFSVLALLMFMIAIIMFVMNREVDAYWFMKLGILWEIREAIVALR